MIPERFEFLFYMCIFTLPPVIICWALHHDYLKKNIKVIYSMIILSVIYQLISDPFAEGWNAWYFSKEKSLGFWIINFPIENTIFIIIIAVAISSNVLVFLKQDKFKQRLGMKLQK